MKQQVATTLRSLREDRGLSQQDVADWFGINRSSVNAWENPEKAALPEVDKLLVLARKYRTTVDSILDGSAALVQASQNTPPNDPIPSPVVSYPSSVTKAIRVEAVVELLSNGSINVAALSSGMQFVKTDKLQKSGDYYALLIASSDNPAFRNGTALLIDKSQSYQIDRLALVTLADGRKCILAPLLDGQDSIRFERMDGTTLSILRSDITSIEHIAAIDSDPE